jgi:hypothetical protein
MKYSLFLLLSLPIQLLSSFDKISYQFSHDPIDVVIPCHHKDSSKLDRTIASVQAYVVGVRRIIVVSSERFTKKAEWFDESLFPFSKKKLAREVYGSKKKAREELHNFRTRLGWLYQQFIKFYAPFCIPHISSNVLIVDADMLFLRPVTFLQENGAGLYAVGDENHGVYFDHAKRVLPSLERLYQDYSGIVHHMLFQREVLADFFNLIRAHHGLEPWLVMARAIKRDQKNMIDNSAMSEYEMYFNFAFARTDQVKIRHLKWKNFYSENEKLGNLKMYYDYVTIHHRIS